jgi:hypothetical protein
MQIEPKPHIGFSEGAPTEVKWSNNSYLRPVEMFEEFNLRPYVLLLSLCWIPLFLTGLVMLNWHKSSPEEGGMDKIGFVGMCAALTGAADLFLHGHLLKYIAIRLVERRQGRLFEPDRKSILVYIEDSKTFNKMKLIPNDFGLLRVHNGYIDLEMMNHRAHLSIKNVSMSIHSFADAKSIPKGIAGVQLTYKTSDWPWAVTLDAPLQNWNLILGADNKRRAAWLLRQLQKNTG